MSEHVGTSTDFQQQARSKKITTRELLNNLNNFVQEFQEFDPKVVLSTPQADCGIGPVQYNLKLRADAQASMPALRALNKTIELERFRGDQLIKFDANLLCLATGKEDPYGFLSPGCRAAIRTEIQQATVKLNEKQKLAYQKDADREIVHELMREADNLPQPPNPAEIALLCDIAPRAEEHGDMTQQHDDFSYSGMKSALAKRRKERRHIRQIRGVIRDQFMYGAYKAMEMTEDGEEDENEETRSQE